MPRPCAAAGRAAYCRRSLRSSCTRRQFYPSDGDPIPTRTGSSLPENANPASAGFAGSCCGHETCAATSSPCRRPWPPPWRPFSPWLAALASFFALASAAAASFLALAAAALSSFALAFAALSAAAFSALVGVAPRGRGRAGLGRVRLGGRGVCLRLACVRLRRGGLLLRLGCVRLGLGRVFLRLGFGGLVAPRPFRAWSSWRLWPPPASVPGAAPAAPAAGGVAAGEAVFAAGAGAGGGRRCRRGRRGFGRRGSGQRCRRAADRDQPLDLAERRLP